MDQLSNCVVDGSGVDGSGGGWSGYKKGKRRRKHTCPDFYYSKHIPTNFPGLFFDTLRPTNENHLSASPVIYSPNQTVKKGTILWGKRDQIYKKEMYNIATGKIIEKDGKKYYEVYPQLLTWEQSKLVANVLKIML